MRYVVLAALLLGGCSALGPRCGGNVETMACPCPAQRNPECYPALTDRRAPDGGARR